MVVKFYLKDYTVIGHAIDLLMNGFSNKNTNKCYLQVLILIKIVLKYSAELGIGLEINFNR